MLLWLCYMYVILLGETSTHVSSHTELGDLLIQLSLQLTGVLLPSLQATKSGFLSEF